MVFATQQNTQITQTERWLCTEHLRAVQNGLTKCNFYLQQTQDGQLRQLIEQCRQGCQQHINSIQSFLQQNGAWQQQASWQGGSAFAQPNIGQTGIGVQQTYPQTGYQQQHTYPYHQ